MAKKNARKKQAPAPDEFDDKKYANVRVSCTYDYDEFAYSKSASTMLEWGRSASLVAALVFLVILVLVLVYDSSNTVLSITLLVCTTLCSAASASWRSIQLRYTDGTTLAQMGSHDRRHVVICDDEVHVEHASGAYEHYPLTELKSAKSTGEVVVLGFGKGRFVYVPKASMSENRFRKLVADMQSRAKKK